MGGDGEETGLLLGCCRQLGVGLLEPRVGLGQGVGVLPALLEHPHPLGVVTGHLGEADVVAVLVGDLGDGDEGPEPAAVLADPPPLLLVDPFPRRDVELVLRVPGLLLLAWIEDAEVLADHLGGGPALGALRADVPAGDVPLGVEHEDGVLADGVDHEAEPLLAVSQLQLGDPLGGHVLALREEVQRLAGAVADHGQRGAPVGVAHLRVIEGHHVRALVHDGRRRVRQRLFVVERLAVGDPEELLAPPSEDAAEGIVGPHDPAVQRHRGHADRGVVEHALEPLDLVLERPRSLGTGLVGLGPACDVLSWHGLGRTACGGRVLRDAHQLVDDVLERRGLGEVRRGAELEGPQRERLLVEPAEHDDAGAWGALQHEGQGLQAVHPGHGDVQQHGVWLEATGEVDGVGAVGTLALHDRGAGQPELCPDQGADLGRVVDDHDPHRARGVGGDAARSRVAGQRPGSGLTPGAPVPSLLSHVRRA